MLSLLSHWIYISRTVLLLRINVYAVCFSSAEIEIMAGKLPSSHWTQASVSPEEEWCNLRVTVRLPETHILYGGWSTSTCVPIPGLLSLSCISLHPEPSVSSADSSRLGFPDSPGDWTPAGFGQWQANMKDWKTEEADSAFFSLFFFALNGLSGIGHISSWTHVSLGRLLCFRKTIFSLSCSSF